MLNWKTSIVMRPPRAFPSDRGGNVGTGLAQPKEVYQTYPLRLEGLLDQNDSSIARNRSLTVSQVVQSFDVSSIWSLYPEVRILTTRGLE